MNNDVAYLVLVGSVITMILLYQAWMAAGSDQVPTHKRFGFGRAACLAIGLLVLLVLTFIALALAGLGHESGEIGSDIIALEAYPDYVVVNRAASLVGVVLVCGLFWIGRPARRGVTGELLRIAQLVVALIGSIALGQVLAYWSVSGSDMVGPIPPRPSGAMVACVGWMAIAIVLALLGIPRTRRVVPLRSEIVDSA